MNWEQYAKSLEDIIERIDMSDHTRILVDRLVDMAKRDAQDNTNTNLLNN